MQLLSSLKPGIRIYDRLLGRELVVDKVEEHTSVVFLHFKNLQTGESSRQPFPTAELDSRFELVDEASSTFRADPQLVSLIAEAHRIQHAYLLNPLFATETSLIDLLPHQLAAVYGVPETEETEGRPGMVEIPRLRFLLADDAGAGKTIMAGLLIREMLLRRLIERVLIVPPAGLVGNWKRELRVLFRLPFEILSGSDAAEGSNPFRNPRNNLAIVSVDTLWRERMREAYTSAPPYDLVVFDEAHKLSARQAADRTIERTNRYEVAETIARQYRHLLLMTATPHMGKDDQYYFLWRLLEPDLLSTHEAFERLTRRQKQQYLLRRMKEEMVRFDETPIYPPRNSDTVEYPLRQGTGQEQDLYDQVTYYCENHFDQAKLRNRSAAGLAMSILQRRLASSTWAMLKSLERREKKLATLIDELGAGLFNEEQFDAQQRVLPTESVRDAKTGEEEEAEDGLEESEQQDQLLEGATDAATLEELQAEHAEVERLVTLARRVYEQKHESKFEQLWETLAQFPDTKVLIFTEFRDTLDFLIDRIQGKGLTGKIAQIHGGMPYQEREEQAAFFRDEARIMVATDAAGEGINLQFCWLLVNYDIPWNPARLEQRMGRVHRYKQEHDVVLLNLVSKNTREGRVLKILLDKLQKIREELGNDKVFDIIGQQFSGKPLSELIFEAVVEGKEEQATGEFDKLNSQHVDAILAAQQRKVESAEVRALLTAVRAKREEAEMRRMMPAYIRRLFQLGAPLVDIGIKGDIENIFYLEPCPPHVNQALRSYPEDIQQRLTFDREIAKPDLTRIPEAIYLHPGEPVYEAFIDLFLGQYEAEAMRGAIFYDRETTEPYIFYLARAQLLRDPPASDGSREPAVVDEKMVGLRRFGNNAVSLAPPHLLLTLGSGDGDYEGESHSTFQDMSGDTGPVQAYLLEEVGLPALQEQKQVEEQRIPERVKRLRAAFNLRRAELFRQRRLLKESVAKGVPAAATKLKRCETELGQLDEQSRLAEAELRTEVDRLRLSAPVLYAQALVLPLPADVTEEDETVDAEQVALEEVIEREEALGAVIDDVSAPHRKAGFDLKIMRPDGEMRYVEVKGRSRTQAIEMTANEWAQAANHRDRYWLYVVYDCATVPTLYRVRDPFGQLLATATGSVSINASQVKAAAAVES